jgi:hypothetical protein
MLSRAHCHAPILRQNIHPAKCFYRDFRHGLLDKNPQLTRSPSPKTGKDETLYTKLRNDLVHAEERGCDPAGAIAAIEAHIDQFQRDVSLVLSGL